MSPEALRNDNVDELSDRTPSHNFVGAHHVELPVARVERPGTNRRESRLLHHRPKIPSWVEMEMEELLLDCWSRESCDRPEFVRIFRVVTNSHDARRVEFR